MPPLASSRAVSPLHNGGTGAIAIVGASFTTIVTESTSEHPKVVDSVAVYVVVRVGVAIGARQSAQLNEFAGDQTACVIAPVARNRTEPPLHIAVSRPADAVPSSSPPDG